MFISKYAGKLKTVWLCTCKQISVTDFLINHKIQCTVGDMEMGNMTPGAGFEATFVFFHSGPLSSSLHHVTSLMSPPYTRLPAYAAPCPKGQYILVHADVIIYRLSLKRKPTTSLYLFCSYHYYIPFFFRNPNVEAPFMRSRYIRVELQMQLLFESLHRLIEKWTYRQRIGNASVTHRQCISIASVTHR